MYFVYYKLKAKCFCWLFLSLILAIKSLYDFPNKPSLLMKWVTLLFIKYWKSAVQTKIAEVYTTHNSTSKHKFLFYIKVQRGLLKNIALIPVQKK